MEAAIDRLTFAQNLRPGILRKEEAAKLETLSAEIASELPEVPAELGTQFPSWLSRLGYFYMQELGKSIDVQRKLLPEKPGAPEGVEVAACYLPRMGVSGDYYDFLSLQEERLGIAVGDVCGKGMGAALLMTSLRANLRTQVKLEPTMTPGELLSCVSQSFYSDTLDHHFATLIYGIWDTDNHTFTYSSAGHPPALYRQHATGEIRELSAGGTILGIYETAEYPSEIVPMNMWDTLVLYTDGIIEAINGSGEAFGIQRLREVTHQFGAESCANLLEAILDSASHFANDHWQDDITLVVMRRIPRH